MAEDTRNKDNAQQAHTPEPWAIDDDDPVIVVSPQGRFMVAMTLPDSDVGRDGTERDYANARRIVACVNGCAGLYDPAGLKDLYAACKAAEDLFTRYGEMYGFTEIAPHMWGMIEDLRAAVDKTNGMDR